MNEMPLGLEIDEFGRLISIIPGEPSTFPELRPEDKLARLLAGRDASGELSNDFLDDLKRGFDLASVQVLLDSVNPRTVGIGLFLLDELAYRAAPLRDVAMPLADSSDSRKRWVFMHFCINTHLVDDEIVAKVGGYLDDPDLRIRVLAIQWITNADLWAVEMLWRVLRPGQQFCLELLDAPWDRYKERALRAFKIGIDMKRGCGLSDIGRQILFEDSYTFVMLTDRSIKIRPFG